MYLPDHFKLTDTDEIADLVKSAPLATLVSQTEQGLRADHIPMMMAGPRMIGHVALANEIHHLLADDHPVMAVFQAADSYISPNWYPSKADTHEVVPTWNYIVAHVHGTIRFNHDPQVKRAAVGQLTKMMEHLTNGRDAWKMSDAPADFLDEKIGEIVAFEINITRVLAKQKLS